MASSAPYEFLTFYRRCTSSTLRSRPSSRPFAARSFTTSQKQRKQPSGGEKEHVLNKKDTLDIQSDNSSKGLESKAKNTGGQATTQSDERNNTERAKKEHPEAPDVVIGMQDERGRKGH